MKIGKAKKEKVNEEILDVINEVDEVNEADVEAAKEEELISNDYPEDTSNDGENESIDVETVVTRPKEENLSLPDKIMNWKLKYDEIYETKICGHTFIWKPLTRKEYKNGYKENDDRDLFTIKTACLYPSSEVIENLVERKGGIGFMLVEIILSESGFNVQSSRQL